MPSHVECLSAGAQMFYNRLNKNLRRLKKWRQQTGIQCYRVYDADMPEYAVAIDLYGEQVHIQEYAPPECVDPSKAIQRFEEIKQACVACFRQPIEALHCKVRHRNPGKQQYQKLGHAAQEAEIQVTEGAAQLWVNLDDYLDTGLFLDHRLLRQRVYQEAAGKHFLNLFCYTASMSVQAALGGAASSVSVDMSSTYLKWAQRNYALNRLDTASHQLVQADCFAWLKAAQPGYDLIVLDPPSFSNSKRMQQTLDIQRDHVSLIQACMRLLNPQGVLYFSNNLRRFKLDAKVLACFDIQNISAQTLDQDFLRNPKIHQCWRISLG